MNRGFASVALAGCLAMFTACSQSVETTQIATFTLEESAHVHLRKAIALMSGGDAAGLCIAHDRQTIDADGRRTMLIPGEHFFVGFDRAPRWEKQGFTKVRVDGFLLYVMPATQDRLRGKVLTATSEIGVFKEVADTPPDRTR